MKISIIIPTFNRYNELLNVLNTIKLWGTKPFEILIMDQSVAFGISEVSDFTEDTFGIKHIQLSTVGVCTARNEGARLAKGDILFFFEDDVLPDKDHDLLKIINEHFLLYPVSCLSGIILPHNPEVFLVRGRFDTMVYITGNRYANFYKNEDYRPTIAVPAGLMAIPKELYLDLGGFDERFDPASFEDRELALRMLNLGIINLAHRDFKVLHVGHKQGGRRDSSNAYINRHRLWAKYLSEENYYYQVLIHWLTKRDTSRKNIIAMLLIRFVILFLHPPAYKSFHEPFS